jgi:undecaprenyl-diphosphatase
MRMLDVIQDFDRRTLLTLQDSRSRLAIHSRSISRSADGYLYAVLGGLWVLAVEDGERLLALLLIAFAIERVAYWVMKNSLRRRRPAQALPGFESHIIASDEFSFPSGHTSGAFLFVTLVLVEVGPAAALLYGWSAAVAMSRVYLGVHFPTDTVMGAVLGTGVALSTALWSLQ